MLAKNSNQKINQKINHKMQIMGILNITPDSFSDGSKERLNPIFALEHAQQLIKDGADIIDVGGESTRPNAPAVSIDTELERVIPIIEQLSSYKKEHKLNFSISIDSYKPEVAQAAIIAGADIINDVSGINCAVIAAKYNTPLIIMHNRIEQGQTPHARKEITAYTDIINDVIQELQNSIQICCKLGVDKQQIILDPGIGFAKTYANNIMLMQNLNKLRAQLNFPLLLGASRKRFLSTLIDDSTNYDDNNADNATVASSIYALLSGCDYIRVHNVKANFQALNVFSQLYY